MPTDLTGAPTSLGIGTYNVDADAPSGLGFNAAMGQIDALLAQRVTTPGGIAAGEAMVWNGAAWARSSVTPMTANGISGYPNDVTKLLHGDGSWQSDEIAYDQITAAVNIVGTTQGGATNVLTGTSHSYDGNPVIAEIGAPAIIMPTVAGASFNVALYEGGTILGVMGTIINPAAAAMDIPLCLRYRFTPAAGAHAYSIKCYVSSTTGTPQFFAGTALTGNTPGYLRVTRAHT